MLEGAKSERIDVYRKDSIKNAESEARCKRRNTVQGPMSLDTKYSNGESFSQALKWTQQRYRPRLLGKKVYLTCEELCYTLDEKGVCGNE